MSCGKTESTATELARVLYFLMVVGYNLRQLEVWLCHPVPIDQPLLGQ